MSATGGWFLGGDQSDQTDKGQWDPAGEEQAQHPGAQGTTPHLALLLHVPQGTSFFTQPRVSPTNSSLIETLSPHFPQRADSRGDYLIPCVGMLASWLLGTHPYPQARRCVLICGSLPLHVRTGAHMCAGVHT